LLRSFGAAGTEETGYLVVPNGSGSLIRFNNGKSGTAAYSQYIYGMDLIDADYTKTQNTQAARMPLYGICRENSSVLVTIERGAPLCYLTADVSGRYNSYKAVIQSLTFNPNLALKLNEQVSVAAGVSAMWIDLDLRRKLPNPLVAGGPDLDFKLCGDSIGYGFNVAGRWEPLEWLSFGAAYQGQVDQDIDGDATVSGRSGDASGDVSLPDMVFLGTAVKPMKKVTVSLDAVRTGWSSYDQFALDLDPTLLGPDKAYQVSQKDWNDVWRYELGVEYALNEAWTLRAGYAFDEEPGPDSTADYLVPANDRNLYCLGAGYQWKAWTFDVSYTYLEIEDRTIAARPEHGVLPSEFECGKSHLFGLTVGRKI
ncbi:MAG TPA: outer membrane protein transport protein, partial [Kiritimatiellia bacterium]|nr:outer membrane protein transport protein [Kiritimatiellia bacterium]